MRSHLQISSSTSLLSQHLPPRNNEYNLSLCLFWFAKNQRIIFFPFSPIPNHLHLTFDLVATNIYEIQSVTYQEKIVKQGSEYRALLNYGIFQQRNNGLGGLRLLINFNRLGGLRLLIDKLGLGGLTLQTD